MDTELNAEQRDVARTITASARTLLDLIENILDISKIEAGKLTLEHIDFDLHRLVNHTAMMFEPQAQKKRHQARDPHFTRDAVPTAG